MPPDSENNLRLEIGHVLFIDLVGYSKLLIEEQKERLSQLTEIVLATAQVREAPDEQLITLPTGDGMALVFRNSSEEPARCALELAEALKKRPEIAVRMGIHSGPVSEVTDVSGRTNIAGAGINLAQRVMDCGDAGHILLSQHVADDLAQYRQWSPLLHDLGECEVKHGVHLHLLNLYAEDLGNPALPEKFQQGKAQTAAAARSSARRKRLLIALAILACLLIALVIVAVIFAPAAQKSFAHQPAAVAPKSASSASPPPAAPAIPGKSIAVLPFENLSSEKENAYFADGVQDEILTHLAKVADLKVISRMSVMNYGRAAGRNRRQIGEELGVAHLLEGGVQRSGNRVRVNAKLINARTGAHLWARTYDRELADVFAIQSEIAAAIAGKLQAKLSPGEKAAIARPPTTDVAAFDLYIRAQKLRDSTSFSFAAAQKLLQEAPDLLNEAVARDPSFFQAYRLLAMVHVWVYFHGLDHTAARLAAAEAALDAAFRLQPDAGEAHLARAWYLYNGYRDYENALDELEIAARKLPNDPRIFELTGYIRRRQGQREEGLRNLKQALEMDPRNRRLLEQTALSYLSLRRYREAAAMMDRSLAIDPDDTNLRVTRASVELDWKADTRPLHKAIDLVRSENPAALPEVAGRWLGCALAERDPIAAAAALAAIGDGVAHGDDTVHFRRDFGEGLLARMTNDKTKAEAAFTAARKEQVKLVQAQPDYAPVLCALGVIDAGLGRKEEALHEGRRAIELLPVAKDSAFGATMVYYFAVIAAWVGEKELACEQLEIATRVSYGDLKLSPDWDPLRGYPRFEKIVASLAPKDAN